MQKVHLELELLFFCFTATSIRLIHHFFILSTFSCLLFTIMKHSECFARKPKGTVEVIQENICVILFGCHGFCLCLKTKLPLLKCHGNFILGQCNTHDRACLRVILFTTKQQCQHNLRKPAKKLLKATFLRNHYLITCLGSIVSNERRDFGLALHS